MMQIEKAFSVLELKINKLTHEITYLRLLLSHIANNNPEIAMCLNEEVYNLCREGASKIAVQEILDTIKLLKDDVQEDS